MTLRCLLFRWRLTDAGHKWLLQDVATPAVITMYRGCYKMVLKRTPSVFKP